MELTFIKVSQKDDNLHLIQEFLNSAGSSLDSFRYYETRDISIISNHLLTVVLFEDDKPVAYGHLDSESERIWLGIAVSESSRGQGYGSIVLDYLLNFATDFEIPQIELTVDLDNKHAQYLYEKKGFVRKGVINNKSFHYIKIINETK